MKSVRFIFSALLTIFLLAGCTTKSSKQQEKFNHSAETEAPVSAVSNKLLPEKKENAITYDQNNLVEAVIRYKDGYQLRNSPDNKDTLNKHLIFGAIVYINDTCSIDTIDGAIGYWYTVILNAHTTAPSKGYVFSDAVYYEESMSPEVLRNKLLIKDYPDIDIIGVGDEMKVKIKSGNYITIDNGLYCDTYFMQFINQLNSCLFSSFCNGEDQHYFFINLETGEKTIFSGLPEFNNTKTHFFVREYAIYEGQVNAISIYKINNYSMEKVFSGALLYEHKKAKWLNNNEISILFEWNSDNNKRTFTSKISKENNEWKIYPGNDMLQETILMYKEFYIFSHEYLKNKSLYDMGLGYMNINERTVEMEDPDEIYKTVPMLDLVSANSKIDSAKLTKIFNMALELDMAGFFSIADYYNSYSDMLQSYTKIYKVMIDNYGKEKLMKLYSEALQNGDKDNMKYFYRRFMVENNIDLKANVIYKKGNSTSIGFWMRRLNDGSADACYNIAIEILKKYDKPFYEKYIVGKGIEKEALHTFPDAEYKDYKNKSSVVVSVSERHLKKNQWIEYLVNINGELKWVSAGDIYFSK